MYEFVSREEWFWVSGIIEGEGSITSGHPSKPNQCRLRVSMSDKDIIERVSSIFGTTVTRAAKPRMPHYKQQWTCTLEGSRAYIFMSYIRPILGERRKAQLDKAMRSYECKPVTRSKLSYQKAEEIRQLIAAGERPIDVAKMFSVKGSCIAKVVRGTRWNTPLT